MPVSPKPIWLEWTVILLIRLMMVVTRLLPLASARALGRWVGAGLYHLNSRMRRVAIRNLELAYPDWPPSRRRSLARQSVQSTGELMAEMGRVWTQPWSRTEAMIEVDGLQCVTEPLASGQGVIVLGPHLGNWELLGMHLATLGNLVALYEPLPFESLISWCIGVGSAQGESWSPPHLAVSQSWCALSERAASLAFCLIRSQR